MPNPFARAASLLLRDSPENTGDTDLVFLEMFKVDHYQDVSLSNWLTHLPPQLVFDHLRISQETLDQIPHEEKVVLP